MVLNNKIYIIIQKYYDIICVMIKNTRSCLNTYNNNKTLKTQQFQIRIKRYFLYNIDIVAEIYP